MPLQRAREVDELTKLKEARQPENLFCFVFRFWNALSMHAYEKAKKAPGGSIELLISILGLVGK